MLEIFVIAVEIAVVAANIFWEHLKVFSNEQVAFQWFVISQFALLFGYLVARSALDKRLSNALTHRIATEIQALQSHLTHSVVALRQDDFYSDFREQIIRARFTVDISHLDTRSPYEAALPGSATKMYYDELARLFKSRPQVNFRRVERVSVEKERWLESLVESMSGRANCSLACLLVEDEPRKLATMSVQLIDTQRAYLVAINEHVDAHAPRDLCITDPTAVKMLLAYYEEMLWKPAAKIVENGNTNMQALAAMRAKISSLRGSNS